MIKICVECAEPKSTDDFYRKRIGADGVVQFQSRCKVCHNAKSTDWQKAHPAAKNAAFKKWRQAHRSYKSPCKSVPAYKKKAQATRVRWAERNPEKHEAGKQRYRQGRGKIYHSEHLAEHCRNQNNRRARLRGNGGTYSITQWRALKACFGNICLCCGRDENTLQKGGCRLVPDHVVAIAKGGSNNIENIQPLCHGKGGCNNCKATHCLDFRPLFVLLMLRKAG